MKIKFVEVDTLPICPFCEKELSEINTFSKGVFIQSVIYSCPHCKKVLSVGYNTP